MTLYDDEGLAGKRGVIYAPFVSPDIIDHVIGANIVRDSKNKLLFPVIVPDDKSKNYLDKLRVEEATRLQGKIEQNADIFTKLRSMGLSNQDIKEKLTPALYDSMLDSIKNFTQQIKILERMEIKSSSNGKVLRQLEPSANKIYVIGHGGPGMNVLAADENMKMGMVTSESLVEQFIDGGLSKAFSDIRTTACYSADASEPSSFLAKDLTKTAKTIKGKRGGLLGLVGTKKPDKLAFGQSLANALASGGFTEAVVTGYHGAGVTFSHSGYHARQLNHDPKTNTRRSTLKQNFRA